MGQDTQELEIKEAPGAAPMPEGGLGTLFDMFQKFGPSILKFVQGLISGTASFVVNYHGLKRWVTISDKAPAE